jgi:hypothetical protein
VLAVLRLRLGARRGAVAAEEVDAELSGLGAETGDAAPDEVLPLLLLLVVVLPAMSAGSRRCEPAPAAHLPKWAAPVACRKHPYRLLGTVYGALKHPDSKHSCKT